METGPSSASDGHSGGVSPQSSQHPPTTSNTPASTVSQTGRMRSKSSSSLSQQSGLARKNSAGSTTSRQKSSQVQTGTTPSHMPPSSTSKTHIGGIQPAAGFFRPQRPPVPALRTSQAQSNSGEVLELNHLGGRRSHESADSLPTSNPNSTYGLTSTSAQNDASTRKLTQSGGRSILSPLLPIGGRTKKTNPSPSSPKSDIRASLDKIFRRTSSDLKRPSPTSRENSSSFFGRRPPSPIDLEIGPLPISRSSIPTSPSSPATPTGMTARQTIQPPGSMPIRSFEPRARPVSATYTENTNPHTDHSHAFISHPTLSDPKGLFPVITTRVKSILPFRSSIRTRNAHVHQSRNRFFFNGRLITGAGDSPLPFIATAVLVLGLTGVWFGTTAVFWWHHSAGGIAITIIGAYLSLLTITNMFVTVSIHLNF